MFQRARFDRSRQGWKSSWDRSAGSGLPEAGDGLTGQFAAAGLVATALVALALIPSVRAEQPGTASVQDEPPRGEMLSFEFDRSAIFPGTTRKVQVYVPRQYDPKTPACVHVNQDGVQFNAPEVFDRLIHEGAMPVTIGVFVAPGRVPGPKGALDRFNRSVEYDGLGDAYARLILEEILPAVEALRTADGRPLRLSQNGNDRSIGGTSSGAICAFTAAWERPDAFSRVFSGIGTYVGLRGGDRYPTLIRKTEPKPIRIFLQDGSNDLNIYAGDWWMANQTMLRALTFAGYDVAHSFDDGQHNNSKPTEIFPEAMRFLWKDWPQPIKAGRGSPQYQELILPGEDWELVSQGHRFTEGPAVNAKGEVFFNDVGASKTYKVGLDGVVSEFLADSRGGNGQAFGPDGKLYAVAAGDQTILAYDLENPSQPKVVAQGFRGNDLVVRHDGSIYVTNPDFAAPGKGRVWRIAPDGTASVVDSGAEPKIPNGVTLSPDQSLLYVADSRSKWVYSYQILPDGSLAHKQKFDYLHVPETADDSLADGIRVDRDGRLWVGTLMGLQICDQAGRVNVILPMPNRERVTNLCFGGPEFNVVYATSLDKVYRRKVKVKGANAFAPPFTPKPPRL